MKLIAFLSPYLGALILTLIIEGALCWLFLQSKHWLKFTCLANLFTNPLVNFVYTVIYLELAKQNCSNIAPWLLLLLEVAVWLTEAWLFYRFGTAIKNIKSDQNRSVSTIYKAMLFSLILNAASYGTGLLLQL